MSPDQLFDKHGKGRNMFFRIRFNGKFIFAAIATLGIAIWLTMAPAAIAQNAVPDAMPTGTETVLYSFGVGPTPDKCKINDGADPRGSLTFVTGTGLLFGRTSTTTSEGNGFGTIFQLMPSGAGYLVVPHRFASPADPMDRRQPQLFHGACRETPHHMTLDGQIQHDWQ